jgi:molybdopterin/thiamine biosynthesis adenylyltransferase
MTRGKSMKVTAEIPQFREVEIKASNSTKIKEVKKRICERLGIDEQLTALLLEGKLLPADATLSQINLQSRKLTVDYMWARHLLLWGTSGQSLIENSRVFLAGAGAIGNEVAKNLVMLGVRKLVIVDYDLVETSNLSRTVFFEKSDVGKPKADVLSRKLQKNYPYIDSIVYRNRVEDLPTKVYLNSDVIVSGLDNVPSRMHLASISRRYSIPMVDAGTIGYEIRVQAYIPPDNPCPICLLPPGNYGQMAGLRNPCTAPLEEMKIPSLPTSMSLVSAIQTQEIAKIILGYDTYLKEKKWPSQVGEPLKGVLLIDLRFNRYSKIELNRNPKCLVCGKDGIAKNTVERYEIFLSETQNSTLKLQKRISELSTIKPTEILMFKEIRKRLVPMETEKKLSSYGLHKGDFLHVVLKNVQDEYSEAVVKLK